MTLVIRFPSRTPFPDPVASFVDLFTTGYLFRVADANRMLVALDTEGFRHQMAQRVFWQLQTLLATQRQQLIQAAETPKATPVTDSRKRRKLKRKAA